MHTPAATPTKQGLLALTMAVLLSACGGGNAMDSDLGTLVGPTAADEPIPEVAEAAPVTAATATLPGNLAPDNPVGALAAGAANAEAPAGQPGAMALPTAQR